MLSQLSEHFTLAEFCATQHRGIDNALPADLLPAARDTCAMLERIRAHLARYAAREVPVHISSGYRCPALNAAVGGATSSDHMRAMAVDFTVPAAGLPHEIALSLEPMVDVLGIGQLIQEFATADGGGWVHISTRRQPNPANRVITIDRSGTRTGICLPAR